MEFPGMCATIDFGRYWPKGHTYNYKVASALLAFVAFDRVQKFDSCLSELQ